MTATKAKAAADAKIEQELADEYPEHAKLRALGGDNQTIGDFLEWLFHEEGIRFTRWDAEYEDVRCPTPARFKPSQVADINSLLLLRGKFSDENDVELLPDHGPLEYHPEDCDQCGGSGYLVRISTENWVEAFPSGNGPLTQRWLAKYFDIDMDRLEQEKRRMLDVLREQNDKRDNA